MNNYTYFKALCSLYQERFEKFKSIDRLNGINDKEFLRKLLKETYVFIKESMINKNPEILSKYFTSEEIEEMKKEIKNLKKVEMM